MTEFNELEATNKFLKDKLMITQLANDLLVVKNAKLVVEVERALKELSSCENDHCFLHWERFNAIEIDYTL